MEIIVEGRKIETKEIWKVSLITESRKCGVLIQLVDKCDIFIGRSIPYETYPSEFQGYYAPYKKLYAQIKEQWDADQLNIPVFKLIK